MATTTITPNNNTTTFNPDPTSTPQKAQNTRPEQDTFRRNLIIASSLALCITGSGITAIAVGSAIDEPWLWTSGGVILGIEAIGLVLYRCFERSADRVECIHRISGVYNSICGN